MKQQSLPHQIRWNYRFVVVDYGGIAIVCAVSGLAPSNQVMPRERPGCWKLWDDVPIIKWTEEQLWRRK